MDDDFERYTPETQGLNVIDLNRIIEAVTRNQSGYSQHVPRVDTTAGRTSLPRPDMFQFMLIQISAVYENIYISGIPVAGYDWVEVVRSTYGLFARPGDGRSGTVYTDNNFPDVAHLNFPAIPITGSKDVALNTGGAFADPTFAYLAWFSADNRTVDFMPLPKHPVIDVQCVNNQIQVTKT